MNPANQAALQLRDIHLPADPGWWPPAPGWWVLAVLLLALLAWTARSALRHYRLHRQRQRLLTMLDTLTRRPSDDATPQAIAEISTLLRRLALMRYPHQRVAALTGAEWLRFLDESGGNDRFSHGPGQILATGPYQPTLPADVDFTALSTLVRDWIKKNTDR